MCVAGTTAGPLHTDYHYVSQMYISSEVKYLIQVTQSRHLEQTQLTPTLE